MQKYALNEVFYSFQGEGYHMGKLAVFIRLAGCNLQCPFCDTKFEANEHVTAEQILEKALSFGKECRFAVITGGEPTLQDLDELLTALKSKQYYIAIETNGTKGLSDCAAALVDWITVSPKPQTKYFISDKLPFISEVKYVVDDNFGLNCINYDIDTSRIWLQPMSNTVRSKKKILTMLASISDSKQVMRIRAGAQLHKIYKVK